MLGLYSWHGNFSVSHPCDPYRIGSHRIRIMSVVTLTTKSHNLNLKVIEYVPPGSDAGQC